MGYIDISYGPVFDWNTVKYFNDCLLLSYSKRINIRKDLQFIEIPTEDFFCPVTFELLQQPQLTLCCGNHLSADAVTRVQASDLPCPLCGTSPWNTVLDKHFQREVVALGVYCHHQDRGCVWQGELSALDTHAESCPMRNVPLLSDLQKLIV